MPREYLQPTAQKPQTEQDVLDDIERRKQEVAAAEEEERRLHAQLDAERGSAAADEAAVQDRIDQLLSQSPVDFVMTFLQTEGQ
jgi:hypothetical protein